MFDGERPIYLQIADRIRDEILSGALSANEQVMSTNQYASFYRINPATAAKAFQLLVEEGILYKMRGIGMFVSPGAFDKLVAFRRQRFFEEVLEPMVHEARMIGISLDDVVSRIEELKGNDER
jgi:GntR family transcriptional regulator